MGFFSQILYAFNNATDAQRTYREAAVLFLSKQLQFWTSCVDFKTMLSVLSFFVGRPIHCVVLFGTILLLENFHE